MENHAGFLHFILLSLAWPPFVSASSDHQALMAFKSSSDPHNRLSTWSSTSDPCAKQWLGVTCRRNRVTRLMLKDLRLSGSVQALFRLDQLRALSVEDNNLTSTAALDLSQLTNIKLLLLSNNRLVGPFPSGVGRLRRLRRLDLSGNRFEGPLPAELNQLPHLLTLRLDRNSFSGVLFQFPSELEDFNVSGNSFAGKIPRSLSVFPPSCFAGNKKLCGRPLRKCSSTSIQSDPIPIMLPSERRRSVSRRAFVAIVVTWISALCLIASLVVYCCCRRRNRCREEKVKEDDAVKSGFEHEGRQRSGAGIGRVQGGEEKMAIFEGCEGFVGVEDLLTASAEILGKGSIGTTYKVVLVAGGEAEKEDSSGGGTGEGTVAVVVKKVRRRKAEGGRREVDGLMGQIGRLRHENVVPLRAYHSSIPELLLVYDFKPNGSLHSLLHGNRGPGRTPLDWIMRLKLAAGAARGLSFLHTDCVPKLAHGHLTSSNILVDQDGNACISDFALDQLMPPSTSPSSTPFSSPSDIYRAPELARGFFVASPEASQKGDVYSFGVVLLEMLTGRMALEGKEGMDLVKWVHSNMSRQGSMSTEMFDLELLRYKEVEVEMFALLQVALLCLNPAPKERPRMSVVHKMIDEIRERAAATSPYELSSTSSPCLSEDSRTFISR